MTEDEMRERIEKLEAVARRRAEQKQRDFEERVIVHAIAGLCANPSFLTPANDASAENLASLVETAIEIARYVTAAGKSTS